MSIYIDDRAGSENDDGGFALYIDGDFQFDTADEALYHEMLALPPLCLAKMSSNSGLRVLICGGGDGLALRECLRYPGVSHVDLVDYSEEIVHLGRTRIAAVNANAFSDSRVSVHIADAWEFLNSPRKYDVILCDFTVPRRLEDTRVFSVEWYVRLKAALAPGGIMGINGVSPQVTPEAFWCLNKTIKHAGLRTLPYHVCIPSFRAHGYGAWAFLLAAHPGTPLSIERLKGISCPVPTRQTEMMKLWRGARFRKSERRIEKSVPVNTVMNGALLPLLLNPGSVVYHANLPTEEDAEISPYQLNPLLRAIPISHPYHTRAMVETLAAQVAGTVRDLDIRRLLEALMRRAAELPSKIMSELTRLREFLKEHTLRFELFSEWSYRLFAALVIMMTMANAIAPDNAFAKGSFSGGAHGGFSVSHSGGGGEGGSFGGVAGSAYSGRSSSSSFGGGRGFSLSSTRSSGSFGRSSSSSVFGAPSSPHFTGSGFRSSYGHGQAVDMYGSFEPSRLYYYCGSGYGHYHTFTQAYGGQRPATPPEKHESLFLASDDLSVLDNGDVVVNVSESAYLLLTNGTAALMSAASPDPLIMLYPDPGLFANVQDQLLRQQAGVQNAIDSRRDWLSWVGWSRVLMPAVAGDRQELNNLDDLSKKLDTAVHRLGSPPKDAISTTPTSDQIELFIGAVLMHDGTISIREAKGSWVNTDGRTLRSADMGAGPSGPCPAMLASALKTALAKARKDVAGGISADKSDMNQLEVDYSYLLKDQNDYESLQSANYGDPNYQVDYGTDEISVSDALYRTQRDLAQNAKDRDATQKDIEKLQTQMDSLDAAMLRFGQ